MLTCIPRSKQPSDDSPSIDHPPPGKPSSNASPTKQAIRSLSFQIKDMALKASGAYRNCAPCVSHPVAVQQQGNGISGGESDSDKSRWSYRRTGSSSSSSNSSSKAGRKELKARLKGISSGEGSPALASGRRVDTVVFVQESEPKEWVAQVEPGVLITFLSLPRGGNDLKQIKFSREMFNKGQAQKWWAENCEKLMELYNVQRLHRQSFPLPSTPRSENGSTSKEGNGDDSPPVTPPLGRERQPSTLHRPIGTGTGHSSPDSLDHQSTHSRSNCDSTVFSSTPKPSSPSGAKTETSSMDTSMRTSASQDIDRSRELSIISNASYSDTEWVEQDEAGVYITIKALPDGRRELIRVRFSREKFGEMHAKVWWEENRARIHKQYL